MQQQQQHYARTYNMSDPVAAAKLFSDLDPAEDPDGMKALKRVDFTKGGFFFPDKDYGSVKEAQQALELSKKRILKIMEQARTSQIDKFQQTVSDLVQEDTNVINMPRIRIQPGKAQSAQGMKPSQMRAGMKSIPASKYITKPANHPFTTLEAAQQIATAYDAASAHHKFKKEDSMMRSLHRTFFSENKSIKKLPEYHVPNLVRPPQAVINCGAERISSDGYCPKFSLTRNHPVNVQAQRAAHLGEVQSSTNQTWFNRNQIEMAEARSTFQIKSHTNESPLKSVFKGSAKKMNMHSNFLGQASTIDKAYAKNQGQNSVKNQERARPKFVFIDPESTDEEGSGAFTANPAEDIPRNKLTEKLARGIQTYVQRMQKREGIRVEVRSQPEGKGWTPMPRECASLTSHNFKTFMIGGMSSDTIKEIVEAEIFGDQVIWKRTPFASQEQIQGRQCHSTLVYQSKLYVFGGCFMFNPKRQVRECTNQVLEFDASEGKVQIVKCKGISVGSRKNHAAACFKGSMIVYGGQSENNLLLSDMLVFHLDTFEWVKIQLKQNNIMPPFVQGGVCSVIPPRQAAAKQEAIRKSDMVQEGIYFFGGRGQNGQLLSNKLRYFKPVTVDRKVVHGEFINIKTGGNAPCPRFGHTMCYLPANNALLVAGGRNDELCKQNITPLLNDLHLFLLDQKVWLQVKYSYNSDRLDYIGNQCMTVVTDGDQYERVLIFGGISNTIGGQRPGSTQQQNGAKGGQRSSGQDASSRAGGREIMVQNQSNKMDVNSVQSFLSNRTFLITIHQRSSGKSFFKDDPVPTKQKESFKGGPLRSRVSSVAVK